MSDAALSALVASLASKQVSTAAADVRKSKQRTAAVIKSVEDVRAAKKIDSIPEVPREILDASVLDSKLEAKLIRHSELSKAPAPRPERWAVSVEEEATQHKATNQLAVSFSKLVGPRLGRKWHSDFTAWLFARRECSASLPSSKPSSGVSQKSDHVGKAGPEPGALTEGDLQLRRKLVAAGEDAATADAICLELSKLPARIMSRIHRPHSQTVKVKVSSVAGDSGKLQLAWQGVAVQVNREHYNKLRKLFVLTHQQHRSVAADSTAFTHAAMAVLLRYASLQGCQHLFANTFQAAIHGEVFDALRSGFGTSLECFASPLNCRWPRFCSACLDTDAPFGSLGSFFQFRPRSGSFEANPPFEQPFVQRVADHIHSLLSASEEELMFVVIIPAWEGAPCWEALRSSPFNQHHLRLAPLEHGYFEGSQHSGSARYRVATTATSIFFLQTAAARRRWPVTPAKLRAVAAAFAPKCGLGSARSKQPQADSAAADGAAQRRRQRGTSLAGADVDQEEGSSSDGDGEDLSSSEGEGEEPSSREGGGQDDEMGGHLSDDSASAPWQDAGEDVLGGTSGVGESKAQGRRCRDAAAGARIHQASRPSDERVGIHRNGADKGAGSSGLTLAQGSHTGQKNGGIGADDQHVRAKKGLLAGKKRKAIGAASHVDDMRADEARECGVQEAQKRHRTGDKPAKRPRGVEPAGRIKERTSNDRSQALGSTLTPGDAERSASKHERKKAGGKKKKKPQSTGKFASDEAMRGVLNDLLGGQHTTGTANSRQAFVGGLSQAQSSWPAKKATASERAMKGASASGLGYIHSAGRKGAGLQLEDEPGWTEAVNARKAHATQTAGATEGDGGKESVGGGVGEVVFGLSKSQKGKLAKHKAKIDALRRGIVKRGKKHANQGQHVVMAGSKPAATRRHVNG